MVIFWSFVLLRAVFAGWPCCLGMSGNVFEAGQAEAAVHHLGAEECEAEKAKKELFFSPHGVGSGCT